MRTNRILISSIIVAFIFWVLETLMDTCVFPPFELHLWPSTSNELWMRLLVFVLIVGLGIEAERLHRITQRVEAQKREIFEATLHSTQHLLNNLTNQMQLVFVEGGQGAPLSEATPGFLRDAIAQSREQVRKLGELRSLDPETIEHAVD